MVYLKSLDKPTSVLIGGCLLSVPARTYWNIEKHHSVLHDSSDYSRCFMIHDSIEKHQWFQWLLWKLHDSSGYSRFPQAFSSQIRGSRKASCRYISCKLCSRGPDKWVVDFQVTGFLLRVFFFVFRSLSSFIHVETICIFLESLYCVYIYIHTYTCVNNYVCKGAHILVEWRSHCLCSTHDVY